MVDPTSELGDDADADDAPTCATCGDPILHSDDHRVVTWVEDDRVHAAHFCDENCRMDWDGE